MSFESVASFFSVWHITRASGMIAYVLLFLSVTTGLMQSGNIVPPCFRPVLAILHTTASWFGLMFALLHAIILLLDDYVGYTVADIFLPFWSDYKTEKQALGILALYCFVLLQVSSDLRTKISRHVWRTIHYGAFAAYILALTHGVLLGTDTDDVWVQGMYIATGAIVCFLLLLRVLLRSAR